MSDFRLSVTGMKRAGSVYDPNKFTFIVGKEEKEYTCSRFQACFISNKICSLLSADPTLDRFVVARDQLCPCFDLIENLWNGDSIHFDQSNISELLTLSRELENEELKERVINFQLANDKISTENVISRFRLKQRISLDANDEIAFIAAKFFEFDIPFLESLSVDELEEILLHESLQLENENALFETISNLCAKNGEYLRLLKYVLFEFMDQEHANAFFEMVFPEYLDGALWESITKVVLKHVSVKSTSKRYVPFKRDELFEYNGSSSPNGIFSSLRRKCEGKNPHSAGFINITASSTGNAERYNVLDYGWGYHWRTDDIENSWIQFDFKERKVSLASYTLKSSNCDEGSWHLKQWKIEGSNDGSKWTQLDTKDTDALNGPLITKHFTCRDATNDYFQYIRLTSTGHTWSNTHYLVIKEIEFFGRLLN